MFTPPKTAVGVWLRRWNITYLACVGTVRGENVTFGNAAASALSRAACVVVPSHQLVKALTTEQSSEQSTRTPRFAARRIARSTASVDAPGSMTYTENSTRSPAAVRSISATIARTTSS